MPEDKIVIKGISNGEEDLFFNYKKEVKLVQENIKRVLLTHPGERPDLNFGVGLQNYLFATNSEEIRGQLKERIISQLTTYVPNIYDLNVDIDVNNQFSFDIIIKYKVPIEKEEQFLILTVNRG